MKTTFVTTTIHLPTFLTAYAADAERYGHEDVNFIVIGDLKSPAETADFCRTIPDCVYMDVESQKDYMRRFPELWHYLPFNSFERRNIGILRAYETGADVIITIDDDNLHGGRKCSFGHKQAGGRIELPVYKSSSGWFNVCSMLKEENGVKFYHRGYSPCWKWDKSAYIDSQYLNSRVVVNAGLWYNNPDTDAVTRLERKLNVVGFGDDMAEIDDGIFGLAPGTWSPFNCQNTALAREVIPAYFLSPHIGRHSDIFASYVIARLAEHFGNIISFGMPLANHARDTYPHSLWHDFDIERWGIQNTDFFCDALRDIEIPAVGTYHKGFGHIIAGLEARKLIGTEWTKMLEGMQIWHDTFERII